LDVTSLADFASRNCDEIYGEVQWDCRLAEQEARPVAAREILDIDPGSLRLPPSRHQGADPVKLARHLARFGKSVSGMPILEVTRAANGELVINSGVTRATRVAKYLPGQMVRVEVIDNLPGWDVSKFPLVKDKLP
jgi:hypothetical protein